MRRMRPCATSSPPVARAGMRPHSRTNGRGTVGRARWSRDAITRLSAHSLDGCTGRGGSHASWHPCPSQGRVRMWRHGHALRTADGFGAPCTAGTAATHRGGCPNSVPPTAAAALIPVSTVACAEAFPGACLLTALMANAQCALHDPTRHYRHHYQRHYRRPPHSPKTSTCHARRPPPPLTAPLPPPPAAPSPPLASVITPDPTCTKRHRRDRPEAAR